MHRAWVTIAIMVGLFVAALDQTIVSTAFPKMVAQLGGAAMFTWVVTAYLLASTAVVPLVGKLSDVYGRKFFWMLGVTVFVGGSVLCGQAENMTQLILFRGLQGIGGGMLTPVAHTIIGDLYTGKERARMQGLFGGVFALASIIGPLVGGWIVDFIHWKYIFLINVPTGAAALLLCAWTMKNETSGGGRKLDWTGSLLSIIGVTSLLLFLQGGGEYFAWDSWQGIALSATSAGAIALFVINELRVPEPILDLKLFANRTFAVATLIAFILGAGMFGVIVFFPWFMQGVIGASAIGSGTVLLPMTLMMVIGSVAGGHIAQRVQYRWLIGGGLSFVCAGFFLATRFTPATTYWDARAAIMLLGLGIGLVQPIMMIAVQQAFGSDRRGTVTAATTFFRSIGSTVGVTVFGALFNWQMSHQFDRLLAPKLSVFPAGMAQAFSALAENPANLVQVLLQPHLQEGIPAGVRQLVTDTIKTMMSNAIHPVFWISIGVMVCGVLIAQFMGRESLTAQSSRDHSPTGRY
ncbi:MAG TPA: MDR family MFS transporter [Symbiobacteriaceae bacterium]|nr:MDR family MFS transporter [Symbiobacteriaceae bacterium]